MVLVREPARLVSPGQEEPSTGEPGPATSVARKESRIPEWLQVTGVALGAIFIVVAFNLGVFLLFVLPPIPGFLWVGAVGTLFLWWHVRSARGDLGRRIRLRRPTVSPAWLAGMVASTFLAMAGIVTFVQMATGPLDLTDSPFHQDVLAFTDDLPGWIVFTFAAAVVIPMIEEFAFRGRLQGFLEPRWGKAAAVLFASVLFAVIHMGGPHPALMAVPLVMGVFLGTAVILARSIWAGVLLHGTWNGAMAVTARLTSPEATAAEELPPALLVPGALAMILLGLLGWAYLVHTARRGRPGEGP